MIIDDKGRLFGLINLLDLAVLVALVIMLYLGGSVYLIYRGAPPELKDFSPKQIHADQQNTVSLILDNKRSLLSAQVRMIPVDFDGQVVLPSAERPFKDPGQINIQIPSGISPGSYRWELELATRDLFSRQRIFTTGLSKPLLIVLPAAARVERQLPSYPWPLEVGILFPSAGEGRIRAGDEMTDSLGRVIARVLSVRPSGPEDTLSLTGQHWWKGPVPFRGGQTARLRLRLDPVDSRLVFQKTVLETGSRLAFRTRDKEWAGYILGKGAVDFQELKDYLRWDVDLVMLALNEEQQKLLTTNPREVDSTGIIWAQVTGLAGELYPEGLRRPGTGLSWLSGGAPLINLGVRVKLLCEHRQGNLYFHNVLVEPEALLTLELNGQKMTGIVQGMNEELGSVDYNLFFPVVPQKAASCLRMGVMGYDPSTNRVSARISQVIDLEPIRDLATETDLEGINLEDTYCRALVRMELYCAVKDDGLYFNGRKIEYGSKHVIRFPSQDLECTVWYGDHLPPARKSAWEDIIILFKGVAPERVSSLRAGLQESVEGQPVTMRIEEVLKDEPTLQLLPTSDGRYVLAENPLFREVRCSVKIKAVRTGERFYYKGQRLLLGSSINFETVQWRLTGSIVGFGRTGEEG